MSNVRLAQALPSGQILPPLFARFFAGIPKVPAKKKESMAIYLVFLQHIIFSLKSDGKAAVVVPTGFISAQSGIEKKIRQKLVDEKIIRGVVSMPSNIFATTGTNVSILFIDKANIEDVVLIDASNLGEKVKEGKNQKTVLSSRDETLIIDTINAKEVVDNFSVVVNYKDIQTKNYSLSAGQYFEIKIEYVDITEEEFQKEIDKKSKILSDMFSQSRRLDERIKSVIQKLKFDS